MTPLMAKQAADILAARGVSPRILEGGAEGLLARWTAFVSEAAAGYSFGLEDYRNDLDLRTLIAHAGLSDLAAVDDQRFRDLLQGDAPVWSSDAPDAWWTRGYPSNSGPVLLQDLRAEGLL